jgi:hypothetical protein
MGDILAQVVRLGGPAAIANSGRAGRGRVSHVRGKNNTYDPLETVLKPLWALEEDVLGGKVHDVGQ